MDTDGLWRALDIERAGLADLMESLTEGEWAAPSLCDRWSVREVAAHLTTAPRVRLRRAVIDFVRARGSFNRMVHDTAVREARASTEEITALMRGIVGSRRLAPGQKLRDAVMDALVHGQDIAIPLGRVRPMPLDAARESAEHLWRIGFPFHARRRLAGVRLVASDVDFRVGDGPEVLGPVSALVPLLAGRVATLPRFEGPGVAVLAARLGAQV